MTDIKNLNIEALLLLKEKVDREVNSRTDEAMKTMPGWYKDESGQWHRTEGSKE